MDIFEKMMSACLESKHSATKVAPKADNKSKVVTESAKTKAPVKKTVVAEKKSFYENKRMFMEDSFEDEMNELDAYDAEAADENEVVDDIVDDIVVVVDPELDEEEISETAEEAQDIVNNTEEGEVPSTDDYVGDLAYICPVCGNTFFSAVELNAGDECPVCSEVPDNFVLVGEVQEAEDVTDEDASEDEVVDDTAEEDVVEDEIVDEEEEEELEVNDVAEESAPKHTLNLDETTFNPFLNKFIRENYKNAKSFVVEGASVNRTSGRLTLECKITFKSGKTKKVTLKGEGYKDGKSVLRLKDDGTFKVESKNVTPILMRLSTVDGIIKCEGMKYDFTTIVEGRRRARITSNPVVERNIRK